MPSWKTLIIKIMEEEISSIAMLLVHKQLLSREQALSLQQSAATQGQRFLSYLSTLGILSSRSIALTLAEHFNLSYLDLSAQTARECFQFDSIPKSLHISLLQKHHVLPLGCFQQQLYVAMDDPSNLCAKHDIQFHTGMQVVVRVVDTPLLAKHLHHYFNQIDQDALTEYAFDIAQPILDDFSSGHIQEDAPVVRLVQRLLYQALEQKASDIHFEPYAADYRIRFRQDGILTNISTPNAKLASRIAARIKIMANMDVAERRLPQDGRFTFDHQALAVDCRVSSCPTIHGEKLVIRLLHTNRIEQLQIKNLALPARDEACVLDAITKPQGLILVTGPTGSGKSTTLYAALNHLNNGDKNILTVEDPVEIRCHGINQVQVNHKMELTFTKILRSFLRQDPDVIMVGEIRDLETAEIAIKASQTGHLVLSTLHTNSAAETLLRLLHLGVPGFQIISSLNLIISQRLLRQLCSYCKVVRQDYTVDDLLAIGYSKDIALSTQFYQAQGCTQCGQGYRSRMAIFEVMQMTSAISRLMMNPEVQPQQLSKKAQEEGMMTLHQAGLAQAALGITSFEEVRRVAI